MTAHTCEKTARRRTQPVAPADLPDRPAVDDPEADAVERIGAQQAVAALVAGLAQDQAEIVLLRVVAGLDVDQVAAIVGKKAGTVRVIQHRALRRLAHLLSVEGVTP